MQTAAWHSWYGTRRWKAIRRQQLQQDPLCKFCADEGTITPASVCDHVERHNGNEERFWNGPFQSLCKLHHDAAKQRAEKRGYDTMIGADGWPIDDRHPANASVNFSLPRGGRNEVFWNRSVYPRPPISSQNALKKSSEEQF